MTSMRKLDITPITPACLGLCPYLLKTAPGKMQAIKCQCVLKPKP